MRRKEVVTEVGRGHAPLLRPHPPQDTQIRSSSYLIGAAKTSKGGGALCCLLWQTNRKWSAASLNSCFINTLVIGWKRIRSWCRGLVCEPPSRTTTDRRQTDTVHWSILILHQCIDFLITNSPEQRNVTGLEPLVDEPQNGRTERQTAAFCWRRILMQYQETKYRSISVYWYFLTALLVDRWKNTK